MWSILVSSTKITRTVFIDSVINVLVLTRRHSTSRSHYLNHIDWFSIFFPLDGSGRRRSKLSFFHWRMINRDPVNDVSRKADDAALSTCRLLFHHLHLSLQGSLTSQTYCTRFFLCRSQSNSTSSVSHMMIFLRSDTMFLKNSMLQKIWAENKHIQISISNIMNIVPDRRF